MGGTGGVIRDHLGTWIVGFSCKVKVANAHHAELLALLHGLKLAPKININHLLVETDSHVLLNTLESAKPIHSHIYLDCRSMLLLMGGSTMKHIMREANSVADILAEYGRKTMDPNMPMNKLFVFEASFSFTLKALERDANGTISFRSVPFYFGNVGILGNSGFGRVGSSGFGILGNNLGLGKAGISGKCGNAVLDRVGSSGFEISGNNLGLGKVGISGKYGNAGLDRVGSSGFGISGNSLGLGKAEISGKCSNACLDRVGSSGFGISRNSGIGKVGISGLGMTDISSFGNARSSGVDNVGITGISGFGRVDSSGFGISGNLGLIRQSWDFRLRKLRQNYFKKMARLCLLHGVPVSIVSDRGSVFTSHFWRALQHDLGTRLDMSTAFHPQTDGQSERTIQVLEDMLRACVIDFGTRWDQHLPLAEFAYNNSYHSSIRMAPFEALYGRRCRSPIGWFDSAEVDSLGTDILREDMERVRVIQSRLLTAQSRQKSYADRRVRPLEFMVGDRVWLRVSPMKGVMRFGKKGKLSPRFIGPYEILERMGDVAYKLALPPSLTVVHPVFHVSMLRKYVPDESHVISIESVELSPDLTFEDEPIAILDRRVRKLRTKDIVSVKVQWRHRSDKEATWESEDDMWVRYPELLETSGTFFYFMFEDEHGF
ncbi:hypothetical protein MTR67_016317 [Solanum verrucosum]|uniref:Uncharacterized protein n=1 Tax=Solanum verrucosum TaxID=315347 RepID=A0AAF0QFP0_SOLVR|nr:hypothetical protein MTR67_016317 [Solanum verrucosum]